ncbi:MAG: hypothetical protein V2A74_10630, partial [bacterium]
IPVFADVAKVVRDNKDQLGGLALTREGLRRRDALVVGSCARLDIPLVVVLAGGYAQRVEDTIEIQAATMREAFQTYSV